MLYLFFLIEYFSVGGLFCKLMSDNFEYLKEMQPDINDVSQNASNIKFQMRFIFGCNFFGR